MAKKPMKTPGAPGAAMTKRSPLGPTSGNGDQGMKVDDASAKDVFAAGLRPTKRAASGNDSALGQKGTRARAATDARSAQHRVTAALPGPVSPEARATQANGKILPSIMGSKQRGNFDADAAFERQA